MFDRFGPCEDDYESTTPFVGMLPDESDKPDGSPLNFGDHGYHERSYRIGDCEEPLEDEGFYAHVFID